jgi:K+-sensing histidine kinase KdpD
VYNPKTVRSSAGSVFHLPVVRQAQMEQAVTALRDRGVTVYAASGTGERDLYSLDLTGPAAFVFGNEAWGLPPEVAALADVTVRIPLAPRAESLNLAAAASVFLFEAVRQRRAAGDSLAGMISGAAHDIRSPLAALTAAASTLRRRWASASDEQRELLLGAIASDAVRMNETLGHLVDAARIGQGALELTSEPVDVADVVRGEAEKLARDPDLPQIQITLVPATAAADRDRLRAVVRSMIRAAAWWGREGSIAVAVHRSGARVRIDVSRGAPELEGNDPSMLFAAGRRGPGAGIRLGLFAGRGFATAQGGSLTAEAGDELRLSLELPAS